MEYDDYDPFDDLSDTDIMREILSKQGFAALRHRYAGSSIYVNRMRHIEQFNDILSDEDATAFVDTFVGCCIVMPTRSLDRSLAFACLFMQGYTSGEIARAARVTETWFRVLMRRLVGKHKALTVLKRARTLRRSEVPAGCYNHNRWKSAYRRSQYLKFLAQLDSIPKLVAQKEEAFFYIGTLKNVLPPDPHLPKKSWRDRIQKNRIASIELEAS